MKVKNMVEEKTGIYKLGFERASFLGILLPLLFVIIIGGGLAFVLVK